MLVCLLGGAMKTLVSLLFILLIIPVKAQEQENGVVKVNKDGQFIVWDERNSKWSSLDKFWDTFAAANKAEHWGKSSSYPNYDDVNEFDTFLVQLDEGTCLMQFFHSRWRRANDVQRWHDSFNEYSGCPYVFN